MFVYMQFIYEMNSFRCLRLVFEHGPRFCQYWYFFSTIIKVHTDVNPYKMGTTHQIRQKLCVWVRLYLKRYSS